MQKSSRPEGVSWVSPYLIVKNPDNAIEFYRQAFDFEQRDAAPGEDGTTWHAELRYKDQIIMIGKQDSHEEIKTSTNSSAINPIFLYLYCDDVDQLYRRALNAGAISEEEPTNMFWGDRTCRLKDPDGHLWCFATYLGEKNE